MRKIIFIYTCIAKKRNNTFFSTRYYVSNELFFLLYNNINVYYVIFGQLQLVYVLLFSISKSIIYYLNWKRWRTRSYTRNCSSHCFIAGWSYQREYIHITVSYVEKNESWSQFNIVERWHPYLYLYFKCAGQRASSHLFGH